MYSISIMIENLNSELGEEVVTNVMIIADLKAITPENLKPIMDELSQLACEKEFMRKGN